MVVNTPASFPSRVTIAEPSWCSGHVVQNLVEPGIQVHDVGVADHDVADLQCLLVRKGEVGAQHQLDVPVRDESGELAVLGHGQVADAMLAHELPGLGHGRARRPPSRGTVS